MTQIVDVELRADAAAPRDARDGIGSLREHLAPQQLLEDVRLLVSELVTNSVRHGQLGTDRSVDLHAEATPERVRVEVRDPGVGFVPRSLEPGAGKTSGWGLYLVDRIASRWGIERRDGTCVWFEIDLAGERAERRVTEEA